MSPRTPSRRPRAADAGRVRLQKLIADAGIASRRAAEDLIREGRVRVNGRVVTELGSRADPRRDRVEVDGKSVGRPARRRDFVLYKPRGVVSTTSDPNGRKTVLDLVPARERLFPVGRLDAQSEGLLLLTNDGALAHVLLHPSFEVEREYRVSVEGAVRAEALRQLARGIDVEGDTLAVSEVELLEREPQRSVLRLTLSEGKRHQIRKLLAAVGHPVRRLVRTRFGPIRLGGLRPASWRTLEPRERQALDRIVRRARPSR